MNAVVALIKISDSTEFTQVLALALHTQIVAQERDWDANMLHAVYLFTDYTNLVKLWKALMSQAVPFSELSAKMKRKEVAILEEQCRVCLFF